MTAPTLPTTPHSPDALADLARLDRFMDALASSAADGRLVRLVLAKPRGGGPAVATQLLRVDVKPLVLRGQACLSLLYAHKTRDITKNPIRDEALGIIRALIGDSFSHAHLFTTDETLQLLSTAVAPVCLVLIGISLAYYGMGDHLRGAVGIAR